ncbi:hypothetical protein GIB67_033531 [Kingdonia uniflora]|uniref:RNase H type-1 domain-containing protein n=1 Tax=Kingdonia uniflora TaxID=39325 RepID=A0A7J7L689_9MAGN|nr:hypothetical protein GIB67_033531 [Kingdonia uniflora]
MKIDPEEVVWGSLLNACKLPGRMDLVELAVKNLIETNPNNVVYGIMLANIYGELGKWDQVGKIKVIHDINMASMDGMELTSHRGFAYVLHGDKGRLHEYVNDIPKFLEEETKRKEVEQDHDQGQARHLNMIKIEKSKKRKKDDRITSCYKMTSSEKFTKLLPIFRKAIHPYHISFEDCGTNHVKYPHGDLLVIMLKVGHDYLHTLLVDTGSAVDVLFKRTINVLGLKDLVKASTTTITGFNGSKESALGEITLPIQAGPETIFIKFIVINVESKYLGILGRKYNIFRTPNIDQWTSSRRFLVDFPVEDLEGEELEEVLEDDSIAKPDAWSKSTGWRFFTDGSAGPRGTGIGIVLVTPSNHRIEKAIKLKFYAINNETDHEAILHGLDIALTLGAEEITVYVDLLLVTNH